MADELLLSLWRDAAKEIAARASRIASESSYRRAMAQLVQIRAILDKLDRDSTRYVEGLIASVYKDADRHAVQLLKMQGRQDVVATFSMVNERAVQYIADGIAGQLRAPIEGIRARADTFFRQTRLEATLNETIQKGLALETAQGSARQQIARRLSDELRKVFEDGKVQITTQTGKVWQYDADYYAQMVAETGRRQAFSAATIMRTADAGIDLVIYSKNFSAVQDFCDAYRGHLFSLSGTHPVAPPLAALPNGGPPSHVHCRHYLSPWVEDFYGEQEMMLRAQTDPRFLYVDAREAQRRWDGIGGMEQARLRHATDEAAGIMAA